MALTKWVPMFVVSESEISVPELVHIPYVPEGVNSTINQGVHRARRWAKVCWEETTIVDHVLSTGVGLMIETWISALHRGQEVVESCGTTVILFADGAAVYGVWELTIAMTVVAIILNTITSWLFRLFTERDAPKIVSNASETSLNHSDH